MQQQLLHVLADNLVVMLKCMLFPCHCLKLQHNCHVWVAMPSLAHPKIAGTLKMQWKDSVAHLQDTVEQLDSTIRTISVASSQSCHMGPCLQINPSLSGQTGKNCVRLLASVREKPGDRPSFRMQSTM